jgi:hypothetical protein
MMVKTENTTIDNKRVIVVQLPARRALALKTQLIKLFGAPVAKLIGSTPMGQIVSQLEKQINMDNIAPAIEMLVSSIQPDTYFKLIIECFAGTKIETENGTHIDVNDQTFDALFSGNLTMMYKALWFSLKVNFADFFGEKGIGKVLRGAPQMPISSKPSQE